ncbi:MAG: diguanylate cyclase [bacterium]|nr:diguanylate cyclase [bacterium]
MTNRILIVDDDQLIRELTQDALTDGDFHVMSAASGPEALERVAEMPFDIVITDLSMREMDGLEVLERIKRESPRTDVIILTGYASLESALQAMRLGAADYLRKPIAAPELNYCVRRTLLRRRLLDENQSLRGCVKAFEATRTLAGCLEASDVLPLTLDILLQQTDRRRAVGRLLNIGTGSIEGVYLQGFPADQIVGLRTEIEQGKLFDPMALDGSPTGRSSGLSAALAQRGLSDEDLLSLPLRVQERIVGGVWIFSDGRPFSRDDQRTSELIVEQAELAVFNAERFHQAREKAFVDDVTEIYNVRYLLSALDREVNRASRQDCQLSVVFLDLDRFKLVNDRYGHLVGSRVLKELAVLLQDSIRAIDTVARYGGDEFTILLVDTDIEAALQVADRIREAVASHPFGADRGLQLNLTVSIGAASFPAHGSSCEALIDRADKAMYMAKALGRNQTCSADEISLPHPP